MNISRDAIIGFTAITIIAVGAIWYFSTTSVTKIEPTSAPETSTPSTQLRLTEHAQYYEVDAAYPSAGSGVTAGASAQMKQWEEDTVTQFKTDSGVTNLTAEDIQTQGLGPTRKYSLTITYAVHTSAHTSSYVFTIFEDTLGAHPNTLYRTFTFDSKTGAPLALGDLFVSGTNYLGNLSKTAKAELPKLIAARENVKVSEVDMGMLNAGITPTADNFQNFYLIGSDLVIIFSPYQIGPYVLGSTDFHIPLSTLEGLKADYK
jgi:hypothetical protein